MHSKKNSNTNSNWKYLKIYDNYILKHKVKASVYIIFGYILIAFTHFFAVYSKVFSLQPAHCYGKQLPIPSWFPLLCWPVPLLIIVAAFNLERDSWSWALTIGQWHWKWLYRGGGVQYFVMPPGVGHNGAYVVGQKAHKSCQTNSFVI